MLYYNRSWRRYLRPFSRVFYVFILLFCIGIVWLIFTVYLFNRINNHHVEQKIDITTRSPSLIFCFVLTENNRHLTSARAIAYSWGKRCDRFYFVTRLLNTSIELMTLEAFENTTDISPTTITQETLNVLLYLQQQYMFAPYHWFLRASDESFVIMPNLRRLINQLNKYENNRPLAYVGDVEELYKKYQIVTSGSVMLFNRITLDRLGRLYNLENLQSKVDKENEKCLNEMIYDHEFVKCMKQYEIIINPINNNLILSQNLSFYKMDKRLKDTCCSSDTAAFRSSNETDMYKFDFLYHRLDALSNIDI
ncbi:unnamed protein product [Adineta steineri]|uniref:Hexosyltransferase n=1 Tax=Adineta steineri TaxID=433720 RepID=A0A814MTJ2_9BILA|nr:unnamed protein product [Adineta steineri]CAF1082924.1 unnamed protein product [Adineta steineri]